MMSTTLSVRDLYLKIIYELKEASLVSPPLGAEPFFDPVVKLDAVDDHGRSKKVMIPNRAGKAMCHAISL